MSTEITPLLRSDKDNSDDNRAEHPRAGSALGPNGIGTRIIALLFMSIVGFGAFFCFDNPGALQTEIKETLNVSTSEFASLYSWYSWPNVILPVIGGYLIDTVFGVRLGTVIFASFICVGQLALGLSTLHHCYFMMKVSRFMFGVGGESLNMALNTYTVTWFRDKELNMVFGFQLSLSRLGSTVNFLLMEPLFSKMKTMFPDSSDSALGWTLMAASTFTVLSLVTSLVLGWLDRRRQRHDTMIVTLTDQQQPSLSDIKQFPPTFWLLCLATLSYYGAIFPFISLAQAYFQTKYDFDAQAANFLVGLVYLVSALSSPLLGWLLDRTQRNMVWMVSSLAVAVLSHALLCWTRVTPYLPMVTLGLSYSVLASALWSLPAIIIKENQLATAFGIMQALQNLGTALITIGAGNIVDTHGYYWLEMFFIGWMMVALVSSLAIWCLDCHGDGSLNLSASQAAQMKRELVKETDMCPIIEDNPYRGL